MPRDSERSLGEMYRRLQAFYEERYTILKGMDMSLDFSQIDATIVYDHTLEHKSSQPIVIIGEAPGANEVLQRTPFVGMAGKNLSALITDAGLSRESDFLITNAFPFRTFQEGANGIKNRTPNTKELQAGAVLLKKELEIVRPQMILLLGGSAKKAFLKLDDTTMTQCVKQMPNHSFQRVKSDMGFDTTIGISFHPSPLVFNMKHKRELLTQFFYEIKKFQI